MAGLENASARAAMPGATPGGAAGTAALGPAGLAVAAASAAQRAANTLTGRMEQMAGHAGMPGANPYAQPAGPPRYAGHQVRRPGPGAARGSARSRPRRDPRAPRAVRDATASRPAAWRRATPRGIAATCGRATPGRATAPATRLLGARLAARTVSPAAGVSRTVGTRSSPRTAAARSPPRATGHRIRRPRHHRAGA